MKKTFFSAGILVLVGPEGEDLLLTVKHHKGEVFKLPGGTSEKQGNRDFYIPDSKNSVLEKIRETLKKVYGRSVIESHKKEVDEILLNLTTTNIGQYALQMVVEFIEEVGLIPTKFELFEHKMVNPDHDQYFFVIKEVMTWSSEIESFISISEGDSIDLLPKLEMDYRCVDHDIQKRGLLPLEEATVKTKHNFAKSHIPVIDGFIIDRERQQQEQKSQDDLLASYGY